MTHLIPENARKNLAETKIQVSWSQLGKFGSCKRKWGFSHIENLHPRMEYDSSESQVRGNLFHIAMNMYLRELLKGQSADAAFVEAIYAMEDKAMEIRSQAKHDSFDATVTLALEVAKKVWTYYIPQTGIGSRYLPISVTSPTGKAPAVELDFEVNLSKNVVFRGTLDALLYDTEAEEVVLVDWKVRGRMPKEMEALVDGQLHAYAAVINGAYKKLGLSRPISRIILWQFMANTPAYPEISKKDNKPLTGRKSYRTTWEFWSAAVEAMGLDPADYEDVMRPKMKLAGHFENRVEMYVTPASDDSALRDLRSKAADVVATRKVALKGSDLPAALSSWACGGCPYKVLCSGPLRYGEDPKPMMETYFLNKDQPFDFDESSETGEELEADE